MSTYDERWRQADRQARKRADYAYEMGKDNSEKASLYYGVYHTEMQAFKQLEAMRKPMPNQQQIDAASAKALSVCPECHLPAPTGRCAHCDGETYPKSVFDPYQEDNPLDDIENRGAPGPSRPWRGD